MRLTRIQMMLAAGATLTAIWLGFVAYYVVSQFGWQNVLFMLPHEIGALLAGIFTPLAFLWLLIVAIGARTRLADVADALGSRLDALAYPPGNAEEKANVVIAAIEAGNNRLLEATDRTAAEAEARITKVAREFEGRFAPGAEAIAAAAEGAAGRVGAVTETLDARRTALISAAEATVGRMGDLFDAMPKHEEALAHAAQDLDERAASLEKLGSRQQLALENAAQALERRAADATTDADRRLREAGEALAREAGALSGAVSDASSRIEGVRTALDGENRDLRKTADEVATELHALGALFRQRAREIEIASGEARDRVEDSGRSLENQTSEFAGALSAAAERTESIVSAFRIQTDALLSASQKASEEAAKVRLNGLDAERDRFLRASRLVIDELNSIGVDITRLMDKSLAEKLWKQFARGDKSVFLRGMIVEADLKKLQGAIRSTYEGNAEFRKYADRYLDLFENLLAQAAASDPENLLSSAFVTADVGKVYVLLSRAIGRMN